MRTLNVDSFDVAWSPDSQRLLSHLNDLTICFWEVFSGKLLKTINTNGGTSVAWSPDGHACAVGGTSKEPSIGIWNTETGQHLGSLVGHSSRIFSLQWSRDGKTLASAGPDATVRLWNVADYTCREVLNHPAAVDSIAWSPDGELLASGSQDSTIRLWNSTTGHQTTLLERHTDVVTSVSFSPDGNLVVSKSQDGSILVWWRDTWDVVAAIQEPTADDCYFFATLAFHPNKSSFASLGKNDRVIRVWQLDVDALLRDVKKRSVHYTTAKLVLVGDSGVGKTGLGWRLAHNEFKEHASTHGQQFWPIQKLGLKRKDGTECEAVLWDLAGQHVYRQIHSIFLENVAAALVLFDPSNRQEPFKGVQFWLEQLKGKGQLPPVVLVGARVDRGAPAVSKQELEQFCQRYGIRGGYISTSAKSNEGLEALLEILKTQISWDEMTTTVTTVTFKRIKDYVLGLKHQPDRKGVLIGPLQLREQLQATDQDWQFTDAEMMTAVGHLETHGYVSILRSSAGEKHILLVPELLVTLASSVVLLADKHPRELGAVSETALIPDKVQFDELSGLPPGESQILLDSAILRFLEHNICFRETLGDANLLIFPGLIKQKRPLQDDLPSTDDISYVVRGRVENLYASLVVLLGYTPSFTRINQWQNQAQYEMDEGEICGFRLIEDREGEIEVVLYYGDQLPPHGRTQFQELFEQFLYQRDVEVTRFPPVICPRGHRQERATIIKRVREGKRFVHCEECGDKTDLPSFDEPQTIGISASEWLQREEAAARLRSAYEVELTKVKSYRRDRTAPRCYVSRIDQQSDWAKDLIKDLREAGVYIVEQAGQVQPDDFVIVLDTPAYQKAFQSRDAVLAGDIPLINGRFGKPELISLALTGDTEPHAFEDCTPGSFCDETHYPVSLFDLVLNLYAIRLTHAAFAPLRQALHMQWTDTLAQKKGSDATSPLKIFISYSHKDESFKNELVTTLAALQRRGVVDTWQDGRIDPGDEWYKSIQNAMNECDLALLLVSPTYIASGFIQEEEQPKLLQRRKEMQLRVIPIIVRPCTWQSEPVLKDLQALPQNGKAVIKFPKATGARDEVWMDIANAIEEWAKQRS